MYLDDIFESGSEDKIASIKRKLRLMVDNDVNLVKLLLKNNNYELNYIELAKPEELVDMLFDVIKSNNNIMENLRQWFKEKWVRFGPDGKIRGDCARGDDSEGKPKCLPQSKAHSLGKKGRASAASRKRREDPNPDRSGPAINVATKKKSVNEFAPTPDRDDDSGQPRWLVTYDIYGTNRDKPLYTSSKKIYANSAKEAIELCKKFFGGRNFRVIQINESIAEGEVQKQETPQQEKVRTAIANGMLKKTEIARTEYYSKPTNTTFFDPQGYASDRLTGIDSIDPDGTVVISIGDNDTAEWVKKLAALGGMPGVKTRQITPTLKNADVAEGAQSQFVAARYIDEFADGEHWYVKGTPQVIQRFVQLANSLEDESVKDTEYEPGQGMMANVHSELGDDGIPQWQIVQAQNLEAIKPIGDRVLQLLMQPDLSYGVQEFMSEFLWTLQEKGLALVTNEPEQGVAEGIKLKFHTVELAESQIKAYAKEYFKCYNIEQPHSKFVSNIKRLSSSKLTESSEANDIAPFIQLIKSVDTVETIKIGDYFSVLSFEINFAWKEINASGFTTLKEVVDIKMHQNGTINYIKFADGDRYPRLTPATYQSKPIIQTAYFDRIGAASAALTTLALKVPNGWDFNTTDVEQGVAEGSYSISDFKINAYESMADFRKWMRSPKKNDRGMTRHIVDIYENIVVKDNILKEASKTFVKRKQQSKEFSENFKQFDKRNKIQIKIGNKIALLSSTIIPDDTSSRIELSGFITPKKIVKINLDNEGKIDSIKFEDGSTFPEASEFTTVGGVNITNTIFFPDRISASKAYSAIWMLISNLEGQGWNVEHYINEGVAEGLSDDVGNIYALHPDEDEGESVAILIKGVDLEEFNDLWTALPMDYLNQFGGDLPLWDSEDLVLYPNIKVKAMTFNQYVDLVGNYIRSDDMANTALSKMKKGVAEGSLNEFAPDDSDDWEDPFDNYPCWDCGSTIFLHHTKLCDLAEDNAIRDLPAEPASQHWTGEIPKGLTPIPGLQEGALNEFAPNNSDNDDNSVPPNRRVTELAKEWLQNQKDWDAMQWIENTLEHYGYKIRLHRSRNTGELYVVVRHKDKKWDDTVDVSDLHYWTINELKQDLSEEQINELKCWPGYTRVRGVPAGAPGSCKKKTNEEKSKHIDSDTVRRIQELLNKKFNANLDVDGILGPLTIQSLKKFLPKTAKKAAPNPERNTAVQGLELKEETCPECGGPIFNEMLLNEKKDACYYKVKSRYKVWPSAYASGALVKCRKKGAKNWGNKSESIEENKIYFSVPKSLENEQELTESFKFNKDSKGWYLKEGQENFKQTYSNALKAFTILK